MVFVNFPLLAGTTTGSRATDNSKSISTTITTEIRRVVVGATESRITNRMMELTGAQILTGMNLGQYTLSQQKVRQLRDIFHTTMMTSQTLKTQF